MLSRTQQPCLRLRCPLLLLTPLLLPAHLICLAARYCAETAPEPATHALLLLLLLLTTFLQGIAARLLH
jgi:hypothetical protein